MRKLLALATVLLGVALFTSPPASALWGGEGGHTCTPSVTPNEHCYAVEVWEPNVHKNIRDVWSFITAEDSQFPEELGSVEFADMETWVGWAEPGTTVEEPESQHVWVEAGMQYGQGVPENGCRYFYAAEYGFSPSGHWNGGAEKYAPCQSVKRQDFTFVKNPSSGEVCVYWNENEVFCSSPSYLPSGPFTRLSSGLEVSTEHEPTALRGTSESFASGGIHNRWHGRTHAVHLFQFDATCVNTGEDIGDVMFAVGKPCNPERGVPWEGEEEPDVLAATPAISEGGEEGDEGPSGSGEPPRNGVDSFAGLGKERAPWTTKGTIEAEARAEAARDFDVRPLPRRLRAKRVQLRSDGLASEFGVTPESGMTPGQATNMKNKVDVVNLLGRFSVGPLSAPEGTGGKHEFTTLNLAYNATTGQLVERTWSNLGVAQVEAEEKAERGRARETCERKGGIYECIDEVICVCGVPARKKEGEHAGGTRHRSGTLALAWAANLSEPPPIVPELQNEEPWELEATALENSKRLRHATIVVERGHSVVAKSKTGALRAHLKPGVYSVTAHAAGFRCGSKRVDVRGNLRVKLDCTRS